MDKNGNLLKFSRDLDSDWTVKNNTPHYGLKEHSSVDTNHGFILSTDLTPASVHDSEKIGKLNLFLVFEKIGHVWGQVLHFADTAPPPGLH